MPAPCILLGDSGRHGQDGLVFVIVVFESETLSHVSLLLQLITCLSVLHLDRWRDGGYLITDGRCSHDFDHFSRWLIVGIVDDVSTIDLVRCFLIFGLQLNNNIICEETGKEGK